MSDPVPCPSPTPTSLLSSATGTVCQTVQQVTGQVSSTASNTVNGVTGGSSGSSGSGGSSGPAGAGGSAAGGTAPGSHAQRAHARHQAHRSRTGSAVTLAAPAVGGLSPLGVPNWLLQAGGLGILPPPTAAPAPLNLPVIHPAQAAQRAAQAANPARQPASRLWLLLVFGGLGLVGGAGGHFLGWPGLRRRKPGLSGPRYAASTKRAS